MIIKSWCACNKYEVTLALLLLLIVLVISWVPVSVTIQMSPRISKLQVFSIQDLQLHLIFYLLFISFWNIEIKYNLKYWEISPCCLSLFRWQKIIARINRRTEVPIIDPTMGITKLCFFFFLQETFSDRFGLLHKLTWKWLTAQVVRIWSVLGTNTELISSIIK